VHSGTTHRMGSNNHPRYRTDGSPKPPMVSALVPELQAPDERSPANAGMTSLAKMSADR